MPTQDHRIRQIEALIARGETYTVEFKSDQRRLPDDDLVKAVACLANGDGGTLLLGVEDDAEVTGLSPSRGTVDPILIQALLMNRTMPNLSCAVEIASVQDRPIAVIDVPKQFSPVGTSEGTYTRRGLRADGKPECVPFALAEMISRAVSVGAQDYALLSVPGLTADDLDPRQFEVFRRFANDTRAGGDSTLATLSDLDIARALRVLTWDGPQPQPLMGALLLFGGLEPIRRFAPSHEALFQVSARSQLSVNQDLTGGLFSSAQALFESFQRHNTTTEIEMGLVHLNVPLVPENAAREAIANALVHRDYAQLGPVRVLIDEDGVTVANPGGFVEGVNVDNILTQSKPRSPALADAFKRAGLVERSGLGVRRMYEAALRLGRSSPDYSQSSRSGVIVRFDTSEIDVALARYFLDVEREEGHRLVLADLMTLQALKKTGKMTLPQAVELTQQPRSQTQSQLTRLEESGLIERRGSPRNQVYHLSAQTYKAVASPSAYFRIRGLDPGEQHHAVLEYVRTTGAITRSQAASICRLTPTQATSLLRSMAASGSLVLRGSHRGSHYVLPKNG